MSKANFSPPEINLLMKCLRTEMNTIENKKTDGATTREKSKAWESVLVLFNNRQTLMKAGGGPLVELKLERPSLGESVP